MDQLRTALSWLKRHHFWVLSGLVALIGLGCWWIASGKLSALFATSQKTITTEFTNLQTLRGAPFHPNDAINQRQDAEYKKQAESVTKLWEQLYERQREKVLQWPDKLSKAFRDAVEKMQFGDEIETELRNNYQNYIEQHFPELPKQVGARVMLATDVGGSVGAEYGRGRTSFNPEAAMGPGGVLDTGQEDDDYICEWIDQIFIRDELNFPQRPRALRIWVTQEDLWVYHTLLDVIAKTNQAAGATRKSNAAVKTIISLEVGKRAAFSSRNTGHLLVPPAMPLAPGAGPMGPESGPAGRGPGPEGGGRGMEGGMMMRGPEGRGGGESGNGASLSPAEEQNFLLSYRYLDDKGQPIPVGGGAPGGEAVPPQGPEAAAAVDPNAAAPPLDLSIFGTGYKRLPVRMVLEMDARWLAQLISACANEPLRVEVQEVRINPSDVAGMESGGGMGGGGFRGFGGERGPGGGGRGSGANLFPDQAGLQNFPQRPNVVNVVIQGTIYIFNKPNPNLLKSSTDQPGPAM